MWVKRQSEARATTLRRTLDKPSEEVLMTTVDTIERADRQ